MLAPESEVSQTWSMQMKKNPSKLSFNIVSYLCTGYGQISLQAALQMGGESKVDKILMS